MDLKLVQQHMLTARTDQDMAAVWPCGYASRRNKPSSSTHTHSCKSLRQFHRLLHLIRMNERIHNDVCRCTLSK